MIAPQPASPHPLGATLPGLYQEDTLAQRLCAALDAVLAPDITMLDCFPAYLDPRTAPPDLLEWLAGWVGLDALPALGRDDGDDGQKLPLERRRDLVRRASQVHALRGTPSAIKELVEIVAGLPVEVDESGGAGWSVDAGSPLPGSNRPNVVVRIRTGAAAPETVATDLLTQLLALVMPGHLPWRLELAP